MYKVDSTIEGAAPILFDRFLGMGLVKPTPEQEEEAAKQRVFRNSNGLYLPAVNLKRALRQGATRAGLKSTGRMGLEPYISAAVFIEPRELEFGKDEPDFMFGTWVRIPPGKKGALVWKVRPGLNPGWRVDSCLHVLDDRIASEKLRIALETAGLFIGVCDWRPEYGRFIVKNGRLRNDHQH